MRPELIFPDRRRLALQVGGLTRFSTVDWPGMIAATVFCQGCGWRCRYCHNPALLAFRGSAPDPEAHDGWTWPAVAAWLRDRRGLLDGVVFSGGEPTLQPGLPEAMRHVRELGFRVGLHTGGPVPAALVELLPLLDWVGFDFKAPFAGYARITARPAGEAARASLALLRQADVAHEVRTTWHPALLSVADLGTMADALVAMEVREWILQPFRADGCADTELVAAGPVGEPPLAELLRPGLRVRVR